MTRALTGAVRGLPTISVRVQLVEARAWQRRHRCAFHLDTGPSASSVPLPGRTVVWRTAGRAEKRGGATDMSTKPAPPDAAAVQQVLRSKRFLAADRAALDLGEIATWDKFLLREHRLLVPIDVQALYVAPGSRRRWCGCRCWWRTSMARTRCRTSKTACPIPSTKARRARPACTCTGPCRMRCCAAAR